MKSNAEKILNGGKEYTAYLVDWYIYKNNGYCFRVRSYHNIICSFNVVLTGSC